MYKNTLPPGINSPSGFLEGRTSTFMPPDPGIPYYVGMKHLRSGQSLQNLFLFLFNAPVYSILPNGDTRSYRILAETGDYLLTEIGEYLLLELAP
jgi:hypothetical protein